MKEMPRFARECSIMKELKSGHGKSVTMRPTLSKYAMMASLRWSLFVLM